MKKGLLALMLLSLVVAIPACKQRDCNDKERGCSPCKIFSCKKKCDDGEKKEKKEKKEKSSCSPCNIFKCKKSCDKKEKMNEKEAPAAPKRAAARQADMR